MKVIELTRGKESTYISTMDAYESSFGEGCESIVFVT
jgi:hypothetical protein